MLISSDVRLLEAELGFNLNSAQKELVRILSKINFDFDEYEPLFVQFPGTDRVYIYQAHRDALTCVNDMVMVPTGFTKDATTFKVVTVAYTFQVIGSQSAYSVSLDDIERVVDNYKEVRPIVANLGRLDGSFFEDYFYEVERKEKRQSLLESIEKRAKEAKKEEHFKSIAKFDPIMATLLDELEELGGF